MRTRCDTLIFSPHVDDEVLGCFAHLGSNCFVLYFGVEDRRDASRQLRLRELSTSAELHGFDYEVLDHTVNRYFGPELIAPMERALNDLRPRTVLLPIPSYNQDHRAVYDAGIAATRPHDVNWLAPNVLLFEQPDSVLWPHGPMDHPTYFVPIDVEAKISAYRVYASQVRGHRSPETVRALACLRGAQIGQPAAEAFVVRRMVAPPASNLITSDLRP
jgi:LmbE family N-acetylglucosaminyl deacetylase